MSFEGNGVYKGIAYIWRRLTDMRLDRFIDGVVREAHGLMSYIRYSLRHISYSQDTIVFP